MEPELPPPPPSQILAYYRSYVKDSRTGELENISAAGQIGSWEWRRDHPSRARDWFRLQQAKARWDEDMARLLVRRAEWDLPPEAAATPPAPPEPEAA
jgi:hypothetical protein